MLLRPDLCWLSKALEKHARIGGFDRLELKGGVLTHRTDGLAHRSVKLSLTRAQVLERVLARPGRRSCLRSGDEAIVSLK